MPHSNSIEYLASGDWLDTILPDFVLAFAFFTAMIYAVLGRRMGHQRPAVAASAALGAALASGLVAWERYNGFSIRSLGPIAAGFAMIVLAGVIYQSIKGLGGSWAGAGIALGACLLVGWTLGVDWPVDPGVVQSVATAMLTVGIIAFLLHRRGQLTPLRESTREPANIRHDMSDLYDDRRVSDQISSGLHRIRDRSANLWQRPDHQNDTMDHLKRILPAEGWLTQRMARLRARAFQIKKGHVARIEELRKHMTGLPTKEKVRISQELKIRYRELRIDDRIERLERLVTAGERDVRELMRQAQAHLAGKQYQKLTEVLEVAEKTQQRCSRLFKLIERTEQKLLRAAKGAAQSAPSK